MLLRARENFLSGQFDTATLLIIANVDKFVNDADKRQRCGLHTHRPEEMVGLDCFGSHHKDLSNAMDTIKQSFRKRCDEEMFEMYRVDIVYGMITNNNYFIATTAWNYLIILSD